MIFYISFSEISKKKNQKNIKALNTNIFQYDHEKDGPGY